MEPIVINSPSIANCNLLELRDDIEKLVEGGCKYVHIDLMDGHYIPNLCFPIRIISDVKKAYPNLTVDLHLMVDDPISYISRCRDAGADYFSFHIDSTNFVMRTIDTIKKAGMKPGVVINPSQRIDVMKPYIDLPEMVTLMAVEPGFAGQKFMPRTVGRTLELAKLRKESGNDFLINIDGAINYENLVPCIKNGANVIVTGIFTIFQQPEGIVGACKHFESEVERAYKEGFSEGAY